MSIPASINPPPRLLMGPGPITADPRVLRAMSAQLVGQYDPWMTDTMNEVMGLYRQVYITDNQQTLLVDGTSRAGIEAALVSLLEPGDRVLVPIFGRFGHLLAEICRRAGADVHTIETEWGQVFTEEALEAALVDVQPKVLAVVHGDTSTTVAQPLEGLGELCERHGALLYVDCTATLGGNEFRTDEWGIDVATSGLQKCLGGPSGSAPVTFSPRAVEVIESRKSIEEGIRAEGDPVSAHPIRSNYLDMAQIFDYWSERRLNHHTEATTMLYGSRECARILLQEGLAQSWARHDLHGRAMLAGTTALGLEPFGALAYRMTNVVGVHIPDGVNGDEVRAAMLEDFGIEIGTSFGPLHGKVWRIGTMGYNARTDAVLQTLAALEAVLRRAGHRAAAGAGVDAAYDLYGTAV
ncbi:pyridoxal-phosphate-dependent aminotransferase family protein [Demequina activiva]|uniref:Aminotransferase V n=1 Tax=Demequina activiva TaxID=1582364 RepID=A0A919Q4Y8_9MICO|nr:alanine--glyoxylate aminotransferase family protein [Demequina activiva]GIG55262.1 aminotransferase V [Demequina activiva]